MMIAIVVRRLICPSDEKRSSQWASLSSMYRRADDDAAVEMSRDLNEADQGYGPSAGGERPARVSFVSWD
jgi:hypothetical protein